jgi:Protein of unknown function (DUF3040)
VPLSEHEQRLLEQMERALHAEDPKFASALQGTRVRSKLRRRVFAAGVGVLVGAGLIAYGAVVHRAVLDVLGALVLIVCAWTVWSTWRRVPAPGQIVAPPRLRRPRTGRARGTFMQRMEMRWQRRRERDNF